LFHKLKSFNLDIQNELTLSKAHDEDEVDGDEPQQIGSHHSVYHDNGWTSQFETSEKQ
jgi:hypothetical protein